MTRNYIDKNIKKALEQLREIMINGIPDKNIPPFDPYHIDFFPIEVNDEKAKWVKPEIIFKVLLGGLWA